MPPTKGRNCQVPPKSRGRGKIYEVVIPGSIFPDALPLRLPITILNIAKDGARELSSN
jgi:hypothetical protein